MMEGLEFLLPVVTGALTVEVVVAALTVNGIAAFVRLRKLANPELATMGALLFASGGAIAAGLGTGVVGALLAGLVAVGVYCRATIPALAKWRRQTRRRKRKGPC